MTAEPVATESCEIALIVCTRNRATQLVACLDSIAAMDVPFDWELIVVDNGSTDGTPTVVRKFAEQQRFPVRYLLEPRAGLSAARNRGLMASRADMLVFTDDDCYPERDFLVQARALLRRDDISFFGGRVLLHDPSDYPCTIKTDGMEEALPPGKAYVPGTLHGANMGFRRAVFEKIGGFDELLGAGSRLQSGEDTEVFGRAGAAGLAGLYSPLPTVRHHHGRKLADIPRLTAGYAVGNGAFYAAMILRSRRAKDYVRLWRWSSSWQGRRRVLREWKGAALYIISTCWRRATLRHIVPRIPVIRFDVRGE